MINQFPRLALLVVASIALAGGVSAAIVFFPGDGDQVAQAQGRDKLTWQTSLAAGSNLAMKEHKYVLADVYVDWCGWCKKLDKDVLTDSELVSYLQKDFICVKVNAEDAREGAAMTRVYKVHGYPCELVFSPEGKLLGRIPGYMAAKGYIATLQHITESANQGQVTADPPDRQQHQQQLLQPQQQQQQPLPRKQLSEQEQMQQLQQLQQQWQQQNQQQPPPQQQPQQWQLQPVQPQQQ